MYPAASQTASMVVCPKPFAAKTAKAASSRRARVSALRLVTRAGAAPVRAAAAAATVEGISSPFRYIGVSDARMYRSGCVTSRGARRESRGGILGVGKRGRIQRPVRQGNGGGAALTASV